MTKRLSAHILLLPQEIQLLDSLVRAEQRRDPRCTRSDIMRAALGAHRPGTRGPFLDVARAVGEDGMCPTCRRPVEVREVLALTPPEPLPPPDFGDDFGDLGLTGVMAGKKKKPRRTAKKKSAPQSPAEPLVPLSTSDKKGFTEILTDMPQLTPDMRSLADLQESAKLSVEAAMTEAAERAATSVETEPITGRPTRIDGVFREDGTPEHKPCACGHRSYECATTCANCGADLRETSLVEGSAFVEDAAGTASLRAEVASVIADKTDLEPTVTKFEKDVADDVKHFLKNQSDVYIPKYMEQACKIADAARKQTEATICKLLTGDEDETEAPAERLPDGAHEHSPAGHIGDERAELPAGPVADAGTGVHAAEDRARGGGPVPDDGGAGRGSPAGGADECTEGRGDVGSGGGEQGQADRVAPAAPRWSVVALPIDGSAPYWFYHSEFLFPPTTKDLALAEAWRIHQNAAGSELDNDYDVAEFRTQDEPPEEGIT